MTTGSRSAQKFVISSNIIIADFKLTKIKIIYQREGEMKPNKNCFFITFLFLLIWAIAFIGLPSMLSAEPFVKGAKLCEECHEEEFKIWEKTKHYIRCILVWINLDICF